MNYKKFKDMTTDEIILDPKFKDMTIKDFLEIFDCELNINRTKGIIKIKGHCTKGYSRNFQNNQYNRRDLNLTHASSGMAPAFATRENIHSLSVENDSESNSEDTDE